MTRTRLVGLVAAPVVFVLPLVADVPGLDVAGERMLAIFLVALVLWVTEAFPLHATAMLIIGLQVALVSEQAVVALPGGTELPHFSAFYQALAHPIIVLLLGGFFLADGAAKYRLTRNFARLLLGPLGGSPRLLVLGVMAVTALFSMFMSNTATSATMIAVVLAVTATLPPEHRLRVALPVSVPVAANVGGLGTPIGSPPSAIALANLAEAGVRLAFVEWMLLTMPFVLLTLVLGWVVIIALFPPGPARVEVPIEVSFDRSGKAWFFYAVFVITVLLWLSEPVHGVESTIVGFLPVPVLLAAGVFTLDDVAGLRWNVLWLVAGGLALSTGVAATGLDAWLLGLVGWHTLPALLLVLLLGVVALGFSTVISNSATANLLVPLGLSLAASPAVAAEPLAVAVLIAAGCSMAMILPVSTPPNAIAYATGALRIKDLATVGGITALVGLTAMTVLGLQVWSTLGVLP